MAEFTADWFTRNIPHWKPILQPLRSQTVSILEIGSYEGRSAVFLLEFLPHSRITCVDPFVASRDGTSGYEARFDANMAPFGDRVRKIKGWSGSVLDSLKRTGERFDVIYIDGDHSRHGTFSNSVSAWPLLNTGGVLIWDDYLWHRNKLPSEDRPEHAIDLFLSVFEPCLTELHRGYQIIARKSGDWPPPTVRGTVGLQAELAAVRDRPAFDLRQWLKRRVTPPKRVRLALRRALRHQA
jgi:Methyltransferase domain